MHAGFERVLQAAKRLGYRTYVTSNGSRLAESGFARRVLPLIDELCLSVHGARAREHDACAGRAGRARDSRIHRRLAYFHWIEDGKF